MMPCVRAEAPPTLTEGAAAWTSAWIARRAADPGAEFRWPVREGRPLNALLMPPLARMTGDRCAWCDDFLVRRDTVDHLRPKSRFPELAFAWDNLFPACTGCQGRQDRWDDRLLKPDDLNYRFYRYFKYDASTGRLEPNPTAAPEEADRAKVTIALFGLNDPRLVEDRRRATRNPRPALPEDRPYRFIGDP